MSTTQSRGSLITIFSQLLALGSVFPNVIDVWDIPGFRSRVLELFQQAEQSCNQGGIQNDVLRTAKFAVAAFIDEMILNSAWPKKEEWSYQTLQYEFFNTQEGGVEFFHQLNGVRRTSPLNTDLLNLFYHCLTLGFEGQYTLNGKEKRKALINEVAHDLQLKQGFQGLSPHAERPDNLAVVHKRNWTPWIVIAICLSSVAILYGIFFFRSTSLSQDVRDQLQTRINSIKQGGS